MSPPSTHLFLNKHIIQKLLFSRITNDLNRKRIVSLQLTADSFYLLAAFHTTGTDSSPALRMTFNVLRHYDA